MYGLNVFIFRYVIFAPVANAVFDNNVQGVVVHAKKNRSFSTSLYKNSDFSFRIVLNCAVPVLSFTSL